MNEWVTLEGERMASHALKSRATGHKHEEDVRGESEADGAGEAREVHIHHLLAR